MSNSNPTWPSVKCFAVVKSDSANFDDEVRQLYIGTSGDVVVVNNDNSTVTFKNLLAGTVIGPFFIKRVNSTGTTAADIVAFY